MSKKKNLRTIYGPDYDTSIIYGAPGSDEEAHKFAITSCQCRYCQAPLRLIKETPFDAGFLTASQRIFYCDECRWWRISHIQEDYHDYGESEDDTWYLEKVMIRDAIIHRFDITSLETPINTLRYYLSKRFDDIGNVHPRQFEELLAAILREHFECEVRLTSQTRDGGYDMYAIIGEHPHLIEVKNHSSPSITEGVRVVRELLGVMLIEGVPNGMLLSSAGRFSAEAIDTANRAYDRDPPHLLQLGDYSMIYDLFRIYDSSDEIVLGWVENMILKK